MLKHHLKLALRYFVRHKGHSVLNVAGLAVGLACCLLIAAYVRDELQYDRLHARRDRIYRVTFQLEGFAELPRDSNFRARLQTLVRATAGPWRQGFYRRARFLCGFGLSLPFFFSARAW